MSDTIRADINAMGLEELARVLIQTGEIRRLIALARDEDLGEPMHDATGELMFADSDTRRVRMVMREPGVLAGLAFIDLIVEAFKDSDEPVQWRSLARDGDRVQAGDAVIEMAGNARAIVRIERTMLNLVSRMSGIATRTALFVDLVKGTGVRLCDTRKTTPGHRLIEKYAVRCGGGTTHRLGLYDAVLIKDNHIAGLDDEQLGDRLEQAASRARRSGSELRFVQVEVDRIEQLARVLALKDGLIDMALLDNMDLSTLAEAIKLRDEAGSSILLEASGGVTLETVAQIAKTGIDRISVGGLTHQAVSLDIGLDTVE